MNSTINNEVDNDNGDGAIKYFTSIKTWNPFFKSIIKPTNKEIINVVLQLYNEILINLPNITIDQQFSKFYLKNCLKTKPKEFTIIISIYVDFE